MDAESRSYHDIQCTSHRSSRYGCVADTAWHSTAADCDCLAHTAQHSHSCRQWLCSIHCTALYGSRQWLCSIHGTVFDNCGCLPGTVQNSTAAIVAMYHTLYGTSHHHINSSIKQYALTFLISSGYLVIRCIGLMRKLLRGMPLACG